MTKRRPKSSKVVVALPVDYARLLAEIKARVLSARIKAGLAANRELLVLYWDIGRLILDRQQKEGWCAKVIDRLSVDLQREFPGQQGFSPRNLKYMRAFAEAWPETLIVQPLVAQLTEPRKSEPVIVPAPLAQTVQPMSPIVQPPVAQLPWKHHLITAASISATIPVSPRGETPVLSKTPAVNDGFGLIEWLAAFCCKLFTCRMFLFEWKTSR